jgi:FdrA protein
MFGKAHPEPTMDQKHRDAPNDLLAAPLRVVNVGLELFATDLATLGAKVVHVQWSPPAGGNARLAGLLDKLRKT